MERTLRPGPGRFLRNALCETRPGREHLFPWPATLPLSRRSPGRTRQAPLLERTLDDSANRRVILPGAFLATDEMLRRALRLARGLVLDRTASARNLAIWGTFAATEPLLMELVRAGADRQQMHEVLRAHSMAAWEAIRRGEPNPLADFLAADERITAFLPPERVRALMDVAGYVGDAPRRARGLAAEVRRRLER